MDRSFGREATGATHRSVELPGWLRCGAPERGIAPLGLMLISFSSKDRPSDEPQADKLPVIEVGGRAAGRPSNCVRPDARRQCCRGCGIQRDFVKGADTRRNCSGRLSVHAAGMACSQANR